MIEREREKLLEYVDIYWIYYFLVFYFFVVTETHISRFADLKNWSVRNRGERFIRVASHFTKSRIISPPQFIVREIPR